MNDINQAQAVDHPVHNYHVEFLFLFFAKMSSPKLRFVFILCCLAGLLSCCNSKMSNNRQNTMDPQIAESVAKTPGSLWTALPQQAFNGMDTTNVRFKKFKLFALDSIQMQSLLLKSPNEKQHKKNSFVNIIELPRPDSGTMKFSIYSTTVMDSALEAKYPSLKTYGGQGVDDRTAMVRLDFNPNGFHAYVISQAGEWFIQPATRGITHQFLICFFKQDALIPNRVPFELPDSRRK